MIYAPAQFEVNTSNSLGGDALTKKIHYLTLNLDIWIKKVKSNIAQYPLHYVSYVPAKFEVATSNGLRRAAFRRNYLTIDQET